ncbi:VTT domain-containing protein [Acuticoccus kandeliae]|uniref:VTT domain-containing protein n=1 Tax=Acuticoccus kandeliae TaxID=2073160 RepID=UPI0013003055|nr:VTT domain-containing protein [Acuticoccus kandeliae]
MTGLIDWLTGHLASHPILVAVIVVVLAASESLIVIGSIVPGTTILLAMAAATGAAGHNLWPMYAAATIGAILGDGISYWIGRRYCDEISRWGPIARRPNLLPAAEAVFRRRGATSIVIARFLPGLRTLVPASAGILGMNPAKFFAANVASAVIWSAAHIFGAGLAGGLLARIGGRLAAALVALIVVVGLVLWLARLIARLSAPAILRARAAVYRWSAARADRPSRILARTLSPDDPTTLLALLWTGVLIGALFLFGGLLEDVQEGDPIVEADLGISRFIQSLRTEWLDHVMVFVTMLGDAVVLGCISVSVVAWLLWRRLWGVAAAFAAASLLPLAIIPVVKTLLGRARPLTELYAGAENYSFPSGHAANSAVLLGLLAVLIGGALKGRPRQAVVAALIAIAVLIGVSRIYLQAHWPSDVVAGFAFAAAITAAFLLALGRLPAADVKPARLGAIAAGVALVVGGWHIATGYQAAMQTYAPRDLSIEIAAADWRTDGWRKVASGRIGFEGHIEAPFLLQWVGDRQPLRDRLAAEGWQTAPSWSLPALRGLLARSTPLDAIPPVPQLHFGRGAVEVWVRPADAGSRLVFRLWPSRFSVGGAPLYVGSVEGERVEHPLGLLSLVDEAAIDPAAATALGNAVRADPAAEPHALVLEGAR